MNLLLSGSSMLAAETSVFDKIYTFFNYIAGLDIIYWAIIFLGLIIVAFVGLLINFRFSYEVRLSNNVDKLNNYFISKPFVGEDNLVEFNNKMKKVVRTLRSQWQLFMLNREDPPTNYINIENCIEKPIKTSSLDRSLANFKTFTVLIVALSWFVSLGAIYIPPAIIGDAGAVEYFFASLIIPCAVLFFYTMFIFALRSWRKAVYADLYDMFPIFERNLSKAVSTLPSYVDYEILFTKKEIRDGIPILQQYLEKRELLEQEALKQARLNQVACEQYNFEELGIDGALVLERAMKECETFLSSKRRLETECDQIETEKENYRKNYEITSKEYQRKLQASRENLESLKTQQESSTNRIESNYIRKQQGDEIKKQQQIEKDSDEATAKFKEEQSSLEEEIAKRKEEIEEKRKFVEQAMLLEFKHYANILYGKLSEVAVQATNDKIDKLNQENSDLKVVLQELQGVQNPEPPVQEEHINPEDIVQDGIYEMTDADKQKLEEDRIAREKEEEEARARKAEFAEQINKEHELDGDQISENEQSAIDEVQYQNNETPVIEPQVASQTEGEVAPSEQPTVGEPAPVVLPPAGDVSVDEMNDLQAKIEQENEELLKQKQEFNKDIDATIQKLDPELPQEIVETTTIKKIRKGDGTEKTTTKTTRKPRTATKKRPTVKKESADAHENSQIESINQEMQNLLNSVSEDGSNGGDVPPTNA